MSSIDILVPDLPESVADAIVTTWHKKPGDVVARDEVLVEIETDKVILEIPASTDGILDMVLEDEGATVISNQILGRLRNDNSSEKGSDINPEDEKSTPIQCQQPSLERQTFKDQSNNVSNSIMRHLLTKHNLEAGAIGADVSDHTSREEVTAAPTALHLSARSEKRVLMTRLRKRVAERLLEAKNSTAMLTTFNEVNMKPIMDLRKQYSEVFKKRHDVRLGFMSFYVKVVVEALKRYPEVNASIDGDDVVYRNYFDVSIAVSTPRGLVTPVLRDANAMGVADIEKKIKELAVKGRDGKLTVRDLTGGNFTIANGGIFGSLMSTPIINPPQSAILGTHTIKDRPMAVNGKVKILPMMYLALSYDHRLIDGCKSVSFLTMIKELLEDPTRLLLDV